MFKKLFSFVVLAQCSFFADSTLAPSRLEVKDGYNMYLEGEFLWWLSQNDNLTFCQDGPTSTSNNQFNGHLKRLNTQFKPGVRVTFGGLMAYDHWDIHFTWTNFSQTSLGRTNYAAYYLGNTFNQPSLASYIKAQYQLSLNMVDAIMTRSSWMGERLSIAPYFGARGTWLDQVFKTKAGLALSGPELTPTYDIYNRARSDFRGAGILSGLGLRYELKSGWCIEGNFLTSGVYGKFVNYYSGYQKDHADTKFESTDRKYFSRDPHQSVLFDVEYKLGIGYNKFIKEGRYHLGGGLAWEQVIFLNGNRLPIWSSPVSSDGTLNGVAMSNPSTVLNLQGISLRFVFGY